MGIANAVNLKPEIGKDYHEAQISTAVGTTTRRLSDGAKT